MCSAMCMHYELTCVIVIVGAKVFLSDTKHNQNVFFYVLVYWELVCKKYFGTPSTTKKILNSYLLTTRLLHHSLACACHHHLPIG